MKKPLLIFNILFILFTLFFLTSFAATYDLIIEGDLSPGATENKLEAIFIDPEGTQYNVTNDSNTEWSSSNTKMAVVYQNGDVIFSGETGNVVFTVTYELGNSTYIATKNLTYDPVESKVYTLVIKDELDPKKTTNKLTLYREYTDDREEKIDNESVTWKSSDTQVAEIDTEGNVLFTGEAGQVTITATYRGRFATITATYPTEIKELTINESLTFSDAFFINSPRLTVTAKINDGTVEKIWNITWTSSNKEVATINNQGYLTLTGKPGTTVITASAEGKTTSKSLTVPDEAAISIKSIFFSNNLFYSTSAQELKVQALFDNNTIRDITNDINLSSSNPELAQIYGKTIYFSGLPGNLTISASYQNQLASVQTYIFPNSDSVPSLAGIKFEKASYSIEDNNKPVIVYGINTDNSKFIISRPVLNVFQENIAEIKNGNLLIKGIPGNATIEASYGRFRDQSSIYNLKPEGTLKPEKIFILTNLKSASKYIPLIAIAKYSDGTLRDISDVAIWNVSNTNYANVSENGKELEIIENKDFTVTAYYEGQSATIASRVYLFPNYTNGINTNIVNINKIYENAQEMLEINSYLPYPKDIQGHWAEKILRNGQIIGWIKGFPDGTLQPDKKITRAEFASFIDRIFDLNAPTDQTFSDTVNHWASPSISKLKVLNICPVYSNTFRPDNFLTREEMADFITKLANIRNTSNNPFFDVEINNPYLSSILKATQSGIMIGMDSNRFAPKDTATRAQALTVINNLLITDVNLSEILK